MKDAKTDDRQFPRGDRRVASLAHALLQAASDGMLILEGARRYPQVAAYEGAEGLRRIYDEHERREALRRIRDLKRHGLIEEHRTAGRIILSCTENGERSLIRRMLRTAPLRPDGRRILVVFDIPERHRAARAALRTLLRTSGCHRLQQSVWTTRRDILAPLSRWIRRRRLKAWIRVYAIDPLEL